MRNDEDIAALRRSVIAIGNALSDRVTLLRTLVDELLSGLVAKGVFTEEEIRAMTARALEEREKHRAEYRVPDDASGPDKMANLQRELGAAVVDLAAIRSLLGRE